MPSLKVKVRAGQNKREQNAWRPFMSELNNSKLCYAKGTSRVNKKLSYVFI